MMLRYAETDIQELKGFLDRGIKLLVKREDMNHPYISGNKWWKLKYNLAEAKRLGYKTLLTFGGAFSNHIYATAAAARELGFESIGIIRGEELTVANSTLTFAKDCGMQLHFISREAYRQKTEDNFIDELRDRFGLFYLIPEGGTNELAIAGTRELGEKLLQTEFDYLILPVGTGGTLAGVIQGLNGRRQVLGVSVLKGDFLKGEVERLLPTEYHNWELLTEYHVGGYAKVNNDLMNFMKQMQADYQLLLDPVYTAKMFWAIAEEAKRGRFKSGSTVLALHTGGLQGANQTSR